MSSASRFLRTLLAAAALAPLAWAAPAPKEPFRLGIAPHTSARIILEMYQPLRSHLEKVLGQPVEIMTATDFTEFARRALAQEFDVAVTTGHQARLLQVDGKYAPLITYKADFMALAIVPKNSPVQKPSDLRGTTIIGLSPSSLVTLWGLHWMKTQKIQDVPVRYVSASDSVVQLLLGGEGSAGFVSLPNLEKLPPETQAGLRVLARSAPMAGRVYMLNARRAAQHARLEAALWAFSKSPEGLKYFEANKLEGYRKVKAGELASLEPYADEVRKILKAK